MQGSFLLSSVLYLLAFCCVFPQPLIDVGDGHTLHLVVRQPTVAHPAPGTNLMEPRGSNGN